LEDSAIYTRDSFYQIDFLCDKKQSIFQLVTGIISHHAVRIKFRLSRRICLYLCALGYVESLVFCGVYIR